MQHVEVLLDVLAGESPAAAGVGDFVPGELILRVWCLGTSSEGLVMKVSKKDWF